MKLQIIKIIIPLYEITGGDHSSGFYGYGKMKILDKVKKDPGARKLLKEVGDNLPLEKEVKQKMKKFVLSVIYGETSDSCASARASKWRKMKKKSMARLPPDDDTLDNHCERVNYLTYCLKHFQLVEHPSPIGHGYEQVNGRCRPVRYTKAALPEKFDVPPHAAEMKSDGDGSKYGDSSGDGKTILYIIVFC